MLTTVNTKNDNSNFSLFVYLRSYSGKSEFSFLETVQSSGNMSFFRTSHFCAKCYYRFLALTSFIHCKKIPLKNYVKFQKWNLKCTPELAYNSFLKKSNLKFCIMFNLISFVNAQGSIKIRLTCSRALLLTISS